jgi:hypothetical protein
MVLAVRDRSLCLCSYSAPLRVNTGVLVKFKQSNFITNVSHRRQEIGRPNRRVRKLAVQGEEGLARSVMPRGRILLLANQIVCLVPCASGR